MLSQAVREYVDSFSCHGLTRICTGRPLEKVLWFLLFAGALAYLIYLVVGMGKEYLEYDIRTEIRLKSVESIYLPTITLCLEVGLIIVFLL